MLVSCLPGKTVRRAIPAACAFAAACLAGACSQAPQPTPRPVAQASAPVPSAHAEAGVAWETGDIDAAFAKAKAQGKPVFLYWGAKWCPPCNQVKATIFAREDFVERSRYFVPVYVDGDRPSGQRLGHRFNVSAYPTMILLRSDGSEVTRLPGEVDAAQYVSVLTLGLNNARPVRETLAAALGGGRDGAALNQDDWRMLAYYSWETDQNQIVRKDRLPSTLARVAAACPASLPDVATRLRLIALASAAGAKDAKPHDDAELRGVLLDVAVDPALARANFDVLVNHGADMVKFVAPRDRVSPATMAPVTQALERLADDATLAMPDRLAALDAEIDLAHIDAQKGPLSATLLARVRAAADEADRTARGPYERQAAISAAADVLASAGLLDESDAMLRAELSRSQAPYYYMLGLAQNAKARGDKNGSLDWSQKAYQAADGPATRLQWGTHYVNALIKLAPDDAPRIEAAALQVIGELDPSPDTFYERNRRTLDRMGIALREWNRGRAHAHELAHIAKRLDAICAQLPMSDASHAACTGVLRAPPTQSG